MNTVLLVGALSFPLLLIAVAALAALYTRLFGPPRPAWVLMGGLAVMALSFSALADPAVGETSKHRRIDMPIEQAIKRLQRAGCTQWEIDPVWPILQHRPSEFVTRISEPVIDIYCVKPTAELVEVSWTFPTARVDGSALPLDQIGGFILAIDGQEVRVGVVERHRVMVLPGVRVVSVKTVDKQGLISAPLTETFVF